MSCNEPGGSVWPLAAASSTVSGVTENKELPLDKTVGLLHCFSLQCKTHRAVRLLFSGRGLLLTAAC